MFCADALLLFFSVYNYCLILIHTFILVLSRLYDISKLTVE